MKLLKENYILTELNKGLYFVLEDFPEGNEQFSKLASFRILLL